MVRAGSKYSDEAIVYVARKGEMKSVRQSKGGSMKSLKERQQERNREVVWVAWVRWLDDTWGPFPFMGAGRGRQEAKERAKTYILEKNIQWAMNREKASFEFSKRVKFRKYILQPNPTIKGR